jgi:hypothetical protein
LHSIQGVWVETRFCCSLESGSGDGTVGSSLSKNGVPGSKEGRDGDTRKVDGVDLVDEVDILTLAAFVVVASTLSTPSTSSITDYPAADSSWVR